MITDITRAATVCEITAIPSPDIHFQNTVGQLSVGAHHHTCCVRISAILLCRFHTRCTVWMWLLYSSHTFQVHMSAQRPWPRRQQYWERTSDTVCSSCTHPSQRPATCPWAPAVLLKPVEQVWMWHGLLCQSQ